MTAFYNWLGRLDAVQGRLLALAFLLVFWGIVFTTLAIWPQQAVAEPEIQVPVYVLDEAVVVKATGSRICIADTQLVVCAPMSSYAPDAYISLVKNERPT